MKFALPTLLGFSLLSFVSAAQGFEVPANLPTRVEPIKTGKDIINTFRDGKLMLNYQETKHFVIELINNNITYEFGK